MTVLRYILLGAGLVIALGSGVAYLAFSTPRATTVLVGCVGVALVAFSNAVKVMNK